MVGGNFCWSGMLVLKFTYYCMHGLNCELIVYTPYQWVPVTFGHCHTHDDAINGPWENGYGMLTFVLDPTHDNAIDGWTPFLSKRRRKRPARQKRAKKKKKSRTDTGPRFCQNYAGKGQPVRKGRKKKRKSRTDTGPRFCRNYAGKGQPAGKGWKKKKTSVVSAIENLCGRFRHRNCCQNCHVMDEQTDGPTQLIV